MPFNRRTLLQWAGLFTSLIGLRQTWADDAVTVKALDGAILADSLKTLRLDGRKITVDLPLLLAVYDLNAVVAKKFPRPSADTGLGQMGLFLDERLAREGYWSTPNNSLSIGGTGGDGAHFSFLVTKDRINAKSPVIITVPDNFGEPGNANVVLADNFRDFIRLGLHCGYFGMAQFAFDPADTVKHYARTDWDDAEEWFPSKNHRAVAEFVAKRLDLSPLSYTQREFDALQARYRPLLTFKQT